MTFKHTFNTLLKLKHVLILLLAIISSSCWALDVPDLFSVQLEAKSDSDTERNALIEKGLTDILRKLCLGECKVETKSLIGANQKALGKYTDGYRYVRAMDKLFISIDFNQLRVKELLYTNQVPYLSEKRPAIVFWVAVDEANNKPKYWLGNRGHCAIKRLEDKGESLSLPFVLPLFDYSDLSLRPDYVGSNEEVELVKKAAERYNTDVVVVGELTEFAGKWKAQAKIYFDNDIVEWSGYSENMLSSFDDVVNYVVDNLISRYSVGDAHIKTVESSGSEVVMLEISGLNSLTQYNKVIEYLRNLPGVSNVQTDGLLDDRGVFILTHKNSKNAVLRSIKLDKFLEQDVDYFNIGDSLKYKVSI